MFARGRKRIQIIREGYSLMEFDLDIQGTHHWDTCLSSYDILVRIVPEAWSARNVGGGIGNSHE